MLYAKLINTMPRQYVKGSILILFTFFAAGWVKLDAQNVAVASSQYASERDWSRALLRSTGVSPDPGKPFTLRAYVDLAHNPRQWEAKEGPDLSIVLDTAQTHVVAVTSNDKTNTTLVEIYDIFTGRLTSSFVVNDFQLTFVWHGNGPRPQHNIWKKQNEDTFYLTGSDSRQKAKTATFQEDGRQVTEPLPPVPTIVQINLEGEVSRTQLANFAGNFTTFLTAYPNSRFILMHNYAIKQTPEGARNSEQVGVLDLDNQRVTVIPIPGDFIPQLSNSSICAVDGRLLLLDGTHHTFAFVTDPIRSSPTSQPLQNLPEKADILYVSGIGDSNSLPIISIFLDEGSNANGKSQIMLFNALSGNIISKGPLWNSIATRAIATQSSTGKIYYVLSDNNLIILDAALNLKKELPLALECPYDFVVSQATSH